jgi:hypothetical protein
MSVRRILDRKLFAKDIVVCHQRRQESRKLSMPVGVRWRCSVENLTQHTCVRKD